MVKKGFSLAEALVVMAIVSVFFAAATKVVTVKRPTPKYQQPHGYYECYLKPNETTHYQYYVRDGIQSGETTSTNCKFEPPIGASMFHFYGYKIFVDNWIAYYYEESAFEITKSMELTFINKNQPPILQQSFFKPNGELDNKKNIAYQIIMTANSTTMNKIKEYFPDIFKEHLKNKYTGFIIQW